MALEWRGFPERTLMRARSGEKAFAGHARLTLPRLSTEMMGLKDRN
jgi:hypothetical protein